MALQEDIGSRRMSTPVMRDLAFESLKIRTILLVELNRLGDAVHALPATRALKRAFPHARISVLFEEANRGLGELEPLIDRVMTVRETRTIGGCVRTVSEARRERYDLVCSMSPIRRNAWVTLAARGRFKIGYLYVWRRTPPHLRHTPISARGFRPRGAWEYGFEHMSNAPLKICSALGVPVGNEGPDVQSIQGGSELKLRNAYIVFHPFAGWEFREWPLSMSREFLSRFLQDTDLSVVIIGGPSEQGRARDLSDIPEYEGRIHVRTGLPMAQLAVVISRAAAFVGTDSGPYQLSSYLGKPALGLFGPNSPEISGSKVEGSVILYHKLDCSPCTQKRCVRPESSCMMLITPEEVLEALRRLLHQ